MPAKKVQSQKITIDYRKKFFLTLITAVFIFIAGTYLQYASVTVYKGTLPCADCSGIQATLTLNGNHTYTLQSLYIDRGNPYTEKGTWQQEEKNNMQVLILQNGSTTSYYQVLNGETIRMLNTNAKPIDAPFNLELKKQ